MSPPPLNQATLIAYAFVALFGFLILRRSYWMMHGTPASATRLLILPFFYVALFVLLMSAVLTGAVGSSIANEVYIAFGLDLVLLVAGTFVAYGYTKRHVHLYKDPGATYWSFRLNAVLPVVYVLLFVARTGLEAAFLGLTPFDVPSATLLASTSSLDLYILFAVDLLWGLSTGFLVGRNVAVYESWQEKLRQEVKGAPVEPALP